MNIRYKTSFLRSIKCITDNRIKTMIEEAINSVKEAKAPDDIPELRKLRGYKKFFRIKVGDYRIGVSIEKGVVTLVVCLPRKDIYKGFP